MIVNNVVMMATRAVGRWGRMWWFPRAIQTLPARLAWAAAASGRKAILATKLANLTEPVTIDAIIYEDRCRRLHGHRE